MASQTQLILARDVPNLGRVGDLVTVRAGYARNFLFPKGLALPASPKRVSQFEHQKKLVDHKRRLLKAESEKKAQEISKIQVTLTAKVGDQGKLFGSITSRDIARALAAEGLVLDHRDVKLDGPIRTIGLHKIDLRLEADVTAQVKVVVAPEVVAEEPKAAEEGAEAAAAATPEATVPAAEA
jgi:large subunit ribosomal protein L9